MLRVNRLAINELNKKTPSGDILGWAAIIIRAENRAQKLVAMRLAGLRTNPQNKMHIAKIIISGDMIGQFNNVNQSMFLPFIPFHRLNPAIESLACQIEKTAFSN